MGHTHDEVMTAITANEPPIRAHQRWELRDEEGRVIRAFRIMAKHPDPAPADAVAPGAAQWIVKEEPVHGRQIVEVVLLWLPEYNLRRLFKLSLDLAEESGTTKETIELPYWVLVETGPGQGATYQHVKTGADIDRYVRDLHGALSVLETIAQFDQGTAGDTAMEFLKRVGIWSANVRRIDGPPAA